MIVSPPRPMTRPSRPAHGIASSASGLTARAKGGEGGGRSQRPRRRGERRGERERERERGRRRGERERERGRRRGDRERRGERERDRERRGERERDRERRTPRGDPRSRSRLRERPRACPRSRLRERRRPSSRSRSSRGSRFTSGARGERSIGPRARVTARSSGLGRTNRRGRPPAAECTRVCATAPRRLRSGVGEISSFERDCLCSVIIFCECSNAKLNVQAHRVALGRRFRVSSRVVPPPRHVRSREAHARSRGPHDR